MPRVLDVSLIRVGDVHSLARVDDVYELFLISLRRYGLWSELAVDSF